jgi:hypothetical protein
VIETLKVRYPKLHDLSTLRHFSFIMIDRKPCYTISSTEYVFYIYIYNISHTILYIIYIILNKFLKHGTNTLHTFFIRLKFKIKYPTLFLRFFKFLHCMNRNAPMFKLTWFLRLIRSDFPGLSIEEIHKEDLLSLLRKVERKPRGSCRSYD